MPEVECGAGHHAAQARQLDHHQQHRADQHPDDHAGDAEPARQEDRRDDDRAVTRRLRGRGPDEVAERVVRRQKDRRDAEQQDRREDQPHVLNRLGDQRGVGPAAEPRADERRGEDFQQDRCTAENEQDERYQGAEDAPQLFAALGDDILAEDRHQRRGDHAADQQIVEDRQHTVGEGEGLEVRAGAEVVRGQLLAHQPEEARQQVAHGDDQGGGGDAAPGDLLHRGGRVRGGLLDRRRVGDLGTHRTLDRAHRSRSQMDTERRKAIPLS